MYRVWEFVIEDIESLPTEVLIEVIDSGVLAVDCGVRSLMHTEDCMCNAVITVLFLHL